jgi:beta-alanine degradation protein BauB
MSTTDGNTLHGLSRRQAVALLSAFGVGADALAQDAVSAEPRSFRVVVDNPNVRVLEYKSRPGLGVCGQGLHYHPAHVTVSLTGAKLKKTEHGKVSLVDIPPGHVFYAEAETHAAEVIGGSGTRTYIIELKGKDWQPSTG